VRRQRDDSGTVLLLTIGLSVVLLLLVAVVVDVSKVVLAKRALSSAADGAAIAAAQQSDNRSIDANGVGESVPLDAGDVDDIVRRYRDEARGEQPGLQLVGTVDAGDPTLAIVQAQRKVPLPFVGWLGIADVTLEAEARARSPLVP
jgi:hypothetical protein